MKHLPDEEKTLPLTFQKFIDAYHTNSNTLDSMVAYMIYLESNTWQHKYGEFKSHQEWARDQLEQYNSTN